MAEASKAKLVWVIHRVPVVRVELVLVLEAPGGGGDVDHQALGDGEVRPGDGVVLGAGSLDR